MECRQSDCGTRKRASGEVVDQGIYILSFAAQAFLPPLPAAEILVYLYFRMVISFLCAPQIGKSADVAIVDILSSCYILSRWKYFIYYNTGSIDCSNGRSAACPNSVPDAPVWIRKWF
jgi:hypothetical protein